MSAPQDFSQPEVVTMTPHPAQARVLSCDKRIIVALAGIQGGKTFVGCLWTQLEIQKKPKGNHLVVALSKDQVKNVILDKFFTWFPAYKPYFNKGEMTLYLPTGGKVFFRSLEEPKYVEGITAHSAWIDEADLASYKGYMVVRGRLNATGGRLLMTSSITQNSWILEHSEKWDPNTFEVITWKSKENPAFSKEEWEALKRETDPHIFRMRYEAQAGDTSGKIYGLFDKHKHVVTTVPADDGIKRYLIGIDWGYVDPTAIVVVGISNKNNVYVLDEFVVEGCPLDLIIEVLNRYKKTYGAKLVYADPSNKVVLKAVESKIFLSIEPGERDIFTGTAIIRNLIFQNRFYVLEHCTWVQKELRLYRFLEGRMGRTEEPEDANNHALDAIRYVCATYPIPKVHAQETPVEDKEDLPEFWKRRTPEARKRERIRQQMEPKYIPLVE